MPPHDPDAAIDLLRCVRVVRREPFQVRVLLLRVVNRKLQSDVCELLSRPVDDAQRQDLVDELARFDDFLPLVLPACCVELLEVRVDRVRVLEHLDRRQSVAAENAQGVLQILRRPLRFLGGLWRNLLRCRLRRALADRLTRRCRGGQRWLSLCVVLLHEAVKVNRVFDTLQFRVTLEFLRQIAQRGEDANHRA